MLIWCEVWPPFEFFFEYAVGSVVQLNKKALRLKNTSQCLDINESGLQLESFLLFLMMGLPFPTHFNFEKSKKKLPMITKLEKKVSHSFKKRLLFHVVFS